jgi:hypothetical protein
MQHGCFITVFFCSLCDDNGTLLIHIKILTSLSAGPIFSRKISIIPKEYKHANFGNILYMQPGVIEPIICEIFACRENHTQI